MPALPNFPQIAQTLKLFGWDFLLTIANLIAPKRDIGEVTPPGPGYRGQWPEYMPPAVGASRSSCPALNAMANHGILPRDGRNITFKELTEKINTTYNFAPTFCYFVPEFAANMLGKNYERDTFNLEDLNLRSEKGIEHDGSLTRLDWYLQEDLSKIAVPYVIELLNAATGRAKNGATLLTIPDLSRLLSKRWAESKANNPQCLLNNTHKAFGGSNASTLLTIFGGRVEDISVMLQEERIPDGWESRIRAWHGLTMMTFNLKTVLWVMLGIDESKFAPGTTDKQT